MTQKTGTPSSGPEKQAPSRSSGQALLKALRSNLKLLGELGGALRGRNPAGAPTADLANIHCPQDVHNLLGPEMSALAQEQLRVLLLDIKNNVLA